MRTNGRRKRVLGIVVMALLVPGGIPLALAALLGARFWPGRFPAFATGGRKIP